MSERRRKFNKAPGDEEKNSKTDEFFTRSAEWDAHARQTYVRKKAVQKRLKWERQRKKPCAGLIGKLKMEEIDVLAILFGWLKP